MDRLNSRTGARSRLIHIGVVADPGLSVRVESRNCDTAGNAHVQATSRSSRHAQQVLRRSSLNRQTSVIGVLGEGIGGDSTVKNSDRRRIAVDLDPGVVANIGLSVLVDRGHADTRSGAATGDPDCNRTGHEHELRLVDRRHDHVASSRHVDSIRSTCRIVADEGSSQIGNADVADSSGHRSRTAAGHAGCNLGHRVATIGRHHHVAGSRHRHVVVDVGLGRVLDHKHRSTRSDRHRP